MNATPLPFSAVLLAGGKSTRMGRDKAGLIIGGQPLWQRQLATLQATAPQELFISGRLDGPYAEAGVPIVVDAVPDLGPLGGLAAAMHHEQHEYLLVLAIDLPAMTPAFLWQLIHLATSNRRGVVPIHGAWFEPLAAVYPRSCLPLVEEGLRHGDRSLQQLIRAARAGGLVMQYELSDEEQSLFQNLNTPADL